MGNTHGKEPWVKMPWVYTTFLVVLSVELKLPVFALMDSNPSRFHIFSVYKCGSETIKLNKI
jgi:DNA topoisomerase VI subunit A